jgi:hypothetical protein
VRSATPGTSSAATKTAGAWPVAAELEAARAAALPGREMFVIFENFDFAFVDPWPGPRFTLVRQRGETAAGFEIRVMKQLSGWGRVCAVMADDFFERGERLLSVISAIPKFRLRVPGAELHISTQAGRSRA